MTDTPLTPVQYAVALINTGSTHALQSYDATLNTSDWNAGTNSGAFMVPDYTTNQLYFYHPLLASATPVTGTLSPTDLTASAYADLLNFISINAPPGHPWADVGTLAETVGDTGLFLIIFGVACIAAGAISFVLQGGPSPSSVWLFRIGIISIIAGVAIEVATALENGLESYFEPSLTNSLKTPNGTVCNTYESGASGCVVICVTPDGTPSSTSCGGGSENFLTDLGIGIAVVAAASIGGYAAYKIVKSHKFGPRQPAPYYPPPAPPAPRPT